MNKEEQAEYNRLYYAAHREQENERCRQYHAVHREQIIERKQRYNAEHRETINKKSRERHYGDGVLPMSKNRACSSFLGVHVAERVLSHIFKRVTRMPLNNHGYDFICANGYKIDVKSGCGHTLSSGATQWMFHIERNTTADYFLCIAFDNREFLNPIHIWLIPSDILSHLTGTSITESTLDKWAEY